jgi:hypothetical protein
MNVKILFLALTLCISSSGACLAAGGDESKPSPVVYLGRSSSFGLPTQPGLILNGRLIQEIVRQAFLVAARDQLGLRTRDVWLGDEMPGGGDNAPFEVLTMADEPSVLLLRRGFPPDGKTLLRHTVPSCPGTNVACGPGQAITLLNYAALLTEAEKLSRGDFVDALRQVGFKGKANVQKKSAAVPKELLATLDKMNFMCQFSAVRQLHELIRSKGESPERLGALVRGYANLGLLTEFHWQPAHKVFKARSLLYAQRMAVGNKPWLASWHRAYAFALAGFHKQAIEDLETADAQWKKAGKASGQRPGWVDVIDAYCHFNHGKLKEACADGPGKELALVLRFDSVMYSAHVASTIQAAMEAAQQIPECYPAFDSICDIGGVSVGHVATTAPAVVAGTAIYMRASAMPGLPDEALKITESASGLMSEKNQRGFSFEEFAARGKLIRALLDSDGKVPAKADPATAAPAAVDRGEPTWVCLGRLVSNLSFMHAWRRAQFEAVKLGVPADDFIKGAAPLVEAHPYRRYLATFMHDPAAKKEAWDHIELPASIDLDPQSEPMLGEYRTRHPFISMGMLQAIMTHLDYTPRDQFLSIVTHFGNANTWCAFLLEVSPYSPMGPAIGMLYCGDFYKDRYKKWEESAADYPVLAMSLGRRAAAAHRLDEAEKWLKIVSVAGDTEAYAMLANVYEVQGKMDLWVKTLEESLDAPDYHLSHARAQTDIARYYMFNKDWEKAMPYAKAAAECYSAWGLEVGGEYLEGTRDWKNADNIYEALSGRYDGEAMVWYAYCRRTGHGNLEAARRAATPHGTRVDLGDSALAYYILENDVPKRDTLLKYLVAGGNPVFEFHMAMLADGAHNNAARDESLNRVKQKAPHFRAKGSRQSFAALGALAGLIVDDLAKGGKGEIDVDAALKLNPPQPFENATSGDGTPAAKPVVAFYYLLGRYLDLHGKPDAAVRCWKQCMGQTQMMADFNRTLAGAELTKHGVKPEDYKSLLEKGEEKAK